MRSRVSEDFRPFGISLQFRFVYLCYVVIKSSRFLLIFYVLTGSYWPKHREHTPLEADTDYTAFLFYFIFVFHDSPGQTMKVFPVLADRPATLHVWFRSEIVCCLHVSIVHRLMAGRVKGCQSWLQQKRHCVWLLAAFCSEKGGKKGNKRLLTHPDVSQWGKCGLSVLHTVLEVRMW